MASQRRPVAPSPVHADAIWRRRLDSESFLNTYTAATHRLQKSATGESLLPSRPSPHAHASAAVRSLLTGSSSAAALDTTLDLPRPTTGESLALSSCSSHNRLTAASAISFPGLNGSSRLYPPFHPEIRPLPRSHSSRTLSLLLREQHPPTRNEVLEARFPSAATWSVYDTAPMRPSLRAALEESYDGLRWFQGSWRARHSRTPRPEAIARDR